MKYIVFFMFVCSTAYGQINTYNPNEIENQFEDVYECLFQSTETEKLIKITHIYMQVAVTQNEISIMVLVEYGNPYSLLHMTDIKWVRGINCLEYESQQHRITYCKDDRLTVENKFLRSKMEFYNGIPQSVEIKK